MTDKFETLNKELLDKSSSWLSELSTTMLKPNIDTPVAKEMQIIGEKIKEIKKQIIQQMRNELGTNKFWKLTRQSSWMQTRAGSL